MPVNEDILKLPAEIRRLAGIKLVKKPQPAGGEGASDRGLAGSSSRPRPAPVQLPKQEPQHVAESPGPMDTDRERKGVTPMVPPATARSGVALDREQHEDSPHRRETRSAAPKPRTPGGAGAAGVGGDAKDKQAQPQQQDSKAEGKDKEKEKGDAKADGKEKEKGEGKAEKPKKPKAEAKEKKEKEKDPLALKKIISKEKKEKGEKGKEKGKDKDGEASKGKADKEKSAGPGAAAAGEAKEAKGGAGAGAGAAAAAGDKDKDKAAGLEKPTSSGGDKEKEEKERQKRADREAQLQRKRERERERRQQLKLQRQKEAAAAGGSGSASDEGSGSEQEVGSPSGRGRQGRQEAAEEGAVKAEPGTSGPEADATAKAEGQLESPSGKSRLGPDGKPVPRELKRLQAGGDEGDAQSGGEGSGGPRVLRDRKEPAGSSTGAQAAGASPKSASAVAVVGPSVKRSSGDGACGSSAVIAVGDVARKPPRPAVTATLPPSGPSRSRSKDPNKPTRKERKAAAAAAAAEAAAQAGTAQASAVAGAAGGQPASTQASQQGSQQGGQQGGQQGQVVVQQRSRPSTGVVAVGVEPVVPVVAVGMMPRAIPTVSTGPPVGSRKMQAPPPVLTAAPTAPRMGVLPAVTMTPAVARPQFSKRNSDSLAGTTATVSDSAAPTESTDGGATVSEDPGPGVQVVVGQPAHVLQPGSLLQQDSATGAADVDMLDAEAAEALQFMQSMMGVAAAVSTGATPAESEATGMTGITPAETGGSEPAATEQEVAAPSVTAGTAAGVPTEGLPEPCQLEVALASTTSPGATAQIVMPRCEREDVTTFKWPTLEPQLPLIPMDFHLPKEWLLVRLPRYEFLKKNFWVSKQRPKRLPREEVNTCMCRPQFVLTGARRPRWGCDEHHGVQGGGGQEAWSRHVPGAQGGGSTAGHVRRA